ncbi:MULTISPECIES: AEC family transporter [Pseudanabaena]|uniref:Auxin Efflux Carrier n=2 Tax=Pseudanabaena TaxID=1152 RepID=L8N4G7_9CYAN|nr:MULTISPECIES: AEC family transporter [Pseudanabaena]ELS34009.1 Auxin Efflux Carrier [Pseudanabaena biceps PCC 7429]MDG3493795.1 AEC family transporter [Pseudanabaena catenata USMAC16]
MFALENPLFILYVRLIGWTLLGYVLGRLLPKIYTTYLGKLLLFGFVPISIISFLRQTDLSGWIVIAPTTAWVAILVGAGLAWIWIDLGLSDERFKKLSRGITAQEKNFDNSPTSGKALAEESAWSGATQGSFLLAMTLGNTAFMGYPVSLALVGPQYFAWSLFYDLIGSTIAAYSVGIALASRFGSMSSNQQVPNPFISMAKTPALWSLPIGLGMRFIPLPTVVTSSMNAIAWTTVTLSLVMIGMQLSQLKTLRNVKQALTCLSIKMLLTPLVVGTGLMFFGVTGEPRMAMVLQMGMPPAFSTLVIAQAYNLDRDLTVTTLAFGVVLLLFTIPIWLWLFS